MPDIDPYQPSDAITDDKRPKASRRSGLAATAAFVLIPIFFGIAGFVGHIALAISLERQPSQNEPMLSHGQQAALISLPICTIIAASAGLALAFAYARQHVTSIVLLSMTFLLGWLVTRSLWNTQIAQYGRDPSEAVLHYPPSGYAASTACLAMLLAIIVILRRTKSGEPSHAHGAAVADQLHFPNVSPPPGDAFRSSSQCIDYCDTFFLPCSRFYAYRLQSGHPQDSSTSCCSYGTLEVHQKLKQ